MHHYGVDYKSNNASNDASNSLSMEVSCNTVIPAHFSDKYIKLLTKEQKEVNKFSEMKTMPNSIKKTLIEKNASEINFNNRNDESKLDLESEFSKQRISNNLYCMKNEQNKVTQKDTGKQIERSHLIDKYNLTKNNEKFEMNSQSKEGIHLSSFSKEKVDKQERDTFQNISNLKPLNKEENKPIGKDKEKSSYQQDQFNTKRRLSNTLSWEERKYIPYSSIPEQEKMCLAIEMNNSSKNRIGRYHQIFEEIKDQMNGIKEALALAKKKKKNHHQRKDKVNETKTNPNINVKQTAISTIDNIRTEDLQIKHESSFHYQGEELGAVRNDYNEAEEYEDNFNENTQKIMLKRQKQESITLKGKIFNVNSSSKLKTNTTHKTNTTNNNTFSKCFDEEEDKPQTLAYRDPTRINSILSLAKEEQSNRGILRNSYSARSINKDKELRVAEDNKVEKKIKINDSVNFLGKQDKYCHSARLSENSISGGTARNPMRTQTFQEKKRNTNLIIEIESDDVENENEDSKRTNKNTNQLRSPTHDSKRTSNLSNKLSPSVSQNKSPPKSPSRSSMYGSPLRRSVTSSEISSPMMSPNQKQRNSTLNIKLNEVNKVFATNKNSPKHKAKFRNSETFNSPTLKPYKVSDKTSSLNAETSLKKFNTLNNPGVMKQSIDISVKPYTNVFDSLEKKHTKVRSSQLIEANSKKVEVLQCEIESQSQIESKNHIKSKTNISEEKSTCQNKTSTLNIENKTKQDSPTKFHLNLSQASLANSIKQQQLKSRYDDEEEAKENKDREECEKIDGNNANHYIENGKNSILYGSMNEFRGGAYSFRSFNDRGSNSKQVGNEDRTTGITINQFNNLGQNDQVVIKSSKKVSSKQVQTSSKDIIAFNSQEESDSNVVLGMGMKTTSRHYLQENVIGHTVDEEIGKKKEVSEIMENFHKYKEQIRKNFENSNYDGTTPYGKSDILEDFNKFKKQLHENFETKEELKDLSQRKSQRSQGIADDDENDIYKDLGKYKLFKARDYQPNDYHLVKDEYTSPERKGQLDKISHENEEHEELYEDEIDEYNDDYKYKSQDNEYIAEIHEIGEIEKAALFERFEKMEVPKPKQGYDTRSQTLQGEHIFNLQQHDLENFPPLIIEEEEYDDQFHIITTKVEEETVYTKQTSQDACKCIIF